MTSTYLAKTKLAFKVAETVQSLEEDRVALKTFQHELGTIVTEDDDLKNLLDVIRNKLSTTSKENRVGRWKDVLTALLAEQPSDDCKTFVKEFADLLD